MGARQWTHGVRREKIVESKPSYLDQSNSYYELLSRGIRDFFCAINPVKVPI